MRTLYVEAFSGISGNMFLGALLNLGVPIDFISEELTKMHLGDYKIIHEPVNKCGIAATYFNVQLSEDEEHEQDNSVEEHNHGHEHEDRSEAHQHEHIIPERHHHHHHPEHRNLSDVTNILNNSTLKPVVKKKAIDVFTALALAEAKVHGKTIEEVHFHEVGAIDTIIDIVGSVLALDYLGIERVFVSKIQTGRGFVRCAHGLMPVPAPATAEMLKQIPHYLGSIEKELVTPTGAALMSVLAEPTEDIPAGFTCSQIGYGAGSWDLSIPNVVRVNLGEGLESDSGCLYVVESNIDDMSGEIYPYALERLLATGALDAWITPIIMKKGRPAHKISALVCSKELDEAIKIIMTETSTLGVRYYPVSRKIAERDVIISELSEGRVGVKIAKFNGERVNLAPEYEDCKKAAENSGKALKTIMREALKKAEETLNDGI